VEKQILADMARKNSQEILSRIGPATPYHHSVMLVAIAASWENFAKMLEL
jgi:hypothetical protein